MVVRSNRTASDPMPRVQQGLMTVSVGLTCTAVSARDPVACFGRRRVGGAVVAATNPAARWMGTRGYDMIVPGGGLQRPSGSRRQSSRA
jgi:hypothetical protein